MEEQQVSDYLAKLNEKNAEKHLAAALQLLASLIARDILSKRPSTYHANPPG
jgi:hypothetical protein